MAAPQTRAAPPPTSVTAMRILEVRQLDEPSEFEGQDDAGTDAEDADHLSWPKRLERYTLRVTSRQSHHGSADGAGIGASEIVPQGLQEADDLWTAEDREWAASGAVAQGKSRPQALPATELESLGADRLQPIALGFNIGMYAGSLARPGTGRRKLPNLE